MPTVLSMPVTYVFPALVALLVSAGCSSHSAAAGRPSPPEVEIATVAEQDVPIYREWIGTLDGMVNAAIRAEVTGYLVKQNYTEGSFVRKGQSLFEIDPRPFRASVEQAQGQVLQAKGQLAQAKAQQVQAEAQLSQAVANQGRTQMDVDRYVPLAKQQAITQQELDNAVQNNMSSKAQVEAAKAGVETAKAQIEAASAAVAVSQAAAEASNVNAGFTHLTSPVDGVAGQAMVQIGNLVSPTSGTITTVSTLNPIKANFTVSEQEYLDFSKRPASVLAQLRLDLILADGSTYPMPGKFLFADRQVNPSTGAILLIGQFPNPGNTLRPGQYAKVRALVGTKEKALLVPQRAVSELQGSYQVALVDNQDKVGFRRVTPGDALGTQWIINDGLKPGERVIVEGGMKVGPGMQVTPKPFKEAR